MQSEKNTKGISPVIAVLLLIVIAVAASVITYSWITWFLTTQQQAASMIRIEEVDLSNAEEGIITIYVRNIGIAKVTVDAVYVNRTRWDIAGSSVTINPGEIKKIVITKPILPPVPPPRSGNIITIKVATRAGTFDIYRGVIP